MQPMRGQRGSPRDHRSVAPLAVEDHGRAVSANPQAAAWYRRAQRAVDRAEAMVALRRAIGVDAHFGLALADFQALTGDVVQQTRARQMNWERHHIEVVRTAGSSDTERAADLLREHLAGTGCDPLALRIVTYLRDSVRYDDGFRDLGVALPGCHPSLWSCSP
jgi:hypothetical protein